MQNIFLTSPRHRGQGLIVVTVYYFQIWNKKEHNIIISRVISSQIGPMYIDTRYIYSYTEWAEIIGQQHGSNVYENTLYWVFLA